MSATSIGVISDTHGFVDPRVPVLFAGVDLILHAGDVGGPGVLRELGKIAPVTAVTGNCDFGLDTAEIEVVTLDGCTVVLTHIFDPRSPGSRMRGVLDRERPAVVVFGHTHVPCRERWDGMLLFNPGMAGNASRRGRRGVGILSCGERGIEARHVAL